MILKLHEQHLSIAGTMTLFGSQEALRRQLIEGGARVSARLTRQTTAVILGVACGEAEAHAIARGLPVLSQRQAKLLIAAGQLQIDDPTPPPTLERDAAISALRPLLAAPSSASWSAVLAALDRCPAEQLGELADYVEGHVSRWEAAAYERWITTPADDAMISAWARHLPYGELRCAPVRWLADMWRGEPSAKHRVVRSVSARGMGATPAQVMALLKLPTLPALTHLDLGEAASASLWRALLTGEPAKRIRRLTVTALSPEHVSAFTEAPVPDSALTHLEIAYRFTVTYPDAMQELLRAPLAAKLKVLTLSGDSPINKLIELHGLSDHTYEVIHLALMQSSSSLRVDRRALYVPCRTLSVVWALDEAPAQQWRALGSLRPVGPDVLDLSGVTVAPDKREEASVGLLSLARALAEGDDAPPAIKLGHWWSEAVAAIFAHYDITVIP